MTYSAVDDLLIGDLRTGSVVSKAGFVQDASDEIDSYIGQRYVTPIVMSSLADHSQKFLKKIANHLATGRLIMALSVGSEDLSTQAYGQSLVNGAMQDILAIVNGSIELVGATGQPAFADSGNSPMITNEDTDSGVETFYRTVMGQENLGWTPY